MIEKTLLANLALRNRTLYRNKQIQHRKSEHATEHQATILGYDSATGRYKVQTTDGRILLAQAICNSAALSKGATINLSTTGGTPMIDGLPTS